MLIQRTIHRSIHGFLAFLFLFTLLLCAAPAAQAAPSDAEKAEDPVTGWVDIKAHVPEGFKGSVSVALENKATGETQIVTSYYLNDYVNSVQIPLGEYTVVSAFTSEDSFIYEASTKTEGFVLKDGVDIEVTVTHNKAGEEILANIGQNPADTPAPSDESPAEPSDPQSTDGEEATESPNTDSGVQQNEEPIESETAEGSEEPAEADDEEDSSIAKAVRNVLLTIAATLAFLIGTILLVVYIRSKFGSD